MKPIVKHLLLILLLIALYFATDFLAKGFILNNLTPYPILGTAFWLLLIYIIFEILVRPVIQFRRLKSKQQIDITTQAQKIKKELEPFKNKNIEESLQSKIYHDLDDNGLQTSIAKGSEDYKNREEKLLPIVNQYFDLINESKNKEAKKIIHTYSWSAALCVVFSRNSFIDGLLMLIAQMKMTVELSKLYGYKPSPLFNTLCFSWIATNSILTGLFAQAGADAVGEVMVEALTDGDLVEGSLATSALSKTSSIAVEALTSATTVYLTGYVVLYKLQGKPELGIKELFKIRRSGRLSLLKEIPQSVNAKLSPKLKDYFSNMKNIFSKTSETEKIM